MIFPTNSPGWRMLLQRIPDKTRRKALGVFSFIILYAVFLAGLRAPHALAAETLFDKRTPLNSIHAYVEYLGQVRLRLLAPGGKTSGPAMELVLDSLAKPPYPGDADFPLALLGDLAAGEDAETPGGRRRDTRRGADRDLQAEALDRLMDEAQAGGLSLSRRLMATRQLGRVISAKSLSGPSLRKSALETLVEISGGKELLLKLEALSTLGPAAVSPERSRQDEAAAAGSALWEQLDQDPESRRMALLLIIQALGEARQPTPVVDRLWSELVGAVEDIRSPRLALEVEPRLKALTSPGAGSPFRKQHAAVQRALKDMSPGPGPVKVGPKEALEKLKATKDPAETEGLLIRLSELTAGNPALASEVIATLTALAGGRDIQPPRLRLLLGGIMDFSRHHQSAFQYFQNAGRLMELALAHKQDYRALLPLEELERLLAGADYPLAVAQALDEAAAVIGADGVPAWLGGRLLELAAGLAGNSPGLEVRERAFSLLAQTASAGNWALRMEAWRRMEQLSTRAGNRDIRTRAARWLKG